MSGIGGRPRIGIVGAGNIASLNVHGYLSDPRCDVVAVCDPVEGRAAAAAAEWGAPKAFTDLGAMLADPDIDAVEILTPTHLHHEHALAAVAAGKHVSCQKPLANSVADARAMATAAEAAGVILRVSECYRHYPPLERARQLIAEGAIGRPTHIRLRTVVGQTHSDFQAGLEADGYVWRMNAHSPGGHLFDDMIHKYAVALWLVDRDIVSVQAVVRRRDHFFEPCAALFEYDDPRLLGTMEVSYAPSMWLRSSFYGADEFFEIQGDEGFLWVTRCTGEMLDLSPIVLYQGGKDNQTTTTFSDVPSAWDLGFDRSAFHFIDALVDGVPAEMSAEDATKALQLCFAVYQAGNTSAAVDPRTIEDKVVPDGWPR
ncbi:MAG: Gfo/Idh/MocA family oxidoreductase [Acidimicrobiales bacterium]|nr:Gfo/Idh/MocA family oxidoreductase [Acidimicrobiales bacterium]